MQVVLYLSVLAIILLFEIVLITRKHERFCQNRSILYWILLSTGYLYCLYLFTIGFRIPFNGNHLKLDFFVTTQVITSQSLLNILLFIPFGFFEGRLLRKCRPSIYHIIITISGGVLSLLIEITQLFSCVGYFEIDDIIFNIFGSAIGAFTFQLGKKIYTKLIIIQERRSL